jgi:hypothetical protein
MFKSTGPGRDHKKGLLCLYICASGTIENNMEKRIGKE